MALLRFQTRYNTKLKGLSTFDKDMCQEQQQDIYAILERLRASNIYFENTLGKFISPTSDLEPKLPTDITLACTCQPPWQTTMDAISPDMVQMVHE